MQLTPGTGNFLCGSCLRDNALALSLRRLGHDCVLAPLYLPFFLEESEAPESDDTVRMGGINVFLQQKLPWLRFLPRLLANRLDSPRLLRWAASHGDMTSPQVLGKMTLSMLRGEEGRQLHELEKLVHWLDSIAAPDVVLLSNAMLSGLARTIRETLDRPVLCTWQGEAPFLDGLPEPYRGQAWATLKERSRDVDGFLPVSRFTAEMMRERLDIEEKRVHVVPNGIDVADFVALEPAQDAQPTVGYLARLCEDKGLPTLVEAFLQLHEGGRVPGIRLQIGGVALAEDQPLLARLRKRIHAAGATGAVDLKTNLSRAQKLELLSSISVFSVPALYGESFGLYLLEALAAGVPVVQPRHAAFPEILASAGGGILVDPGDPAALAAGLEELLSDPDRARALGRAGRAAVREQFSAERMARDVERVCRMFAAPTPARA